jgi:acetyltransferase
MKASIGQALPEAQLSGFTVQNMVDNSTAHELIAGVTVDPTFGPVVLFGQGGTEVEIIHDRAVALPPLNMMLAKDLISRTRVAKLLTGHRHFKPADRDAICHVLISLSRLVSDIPEIQGIDINPLLADHQGAIALDARITLASVVAGQTDRLAIRPYPAALKEETEFMGRPLTLRPIKPEDEPQHRELFDLLDTPDIRFRFFGMLNTPSHENLAKFTQIDYDREMAFIASRFREDGHAETLGVARAQSDPDNIAAEFSIVIRSDVKGHGLGSLLMKKIISYCHSRQTQQLIGQVLPNNDRMLSLAKENGFTIHHEIGDGFVEIRLPLQF